MLSGGVEADDFLIAARDRTRRRGPRARGRCSRRPGTPRAGAGAAPPGSSRTAGPAAAQVRRGRARREPPHLAPRDLEPRVLGHRTSCGLSTAGPRSLRGRALLEVLASRARRHHGPGRRLLPGVLPPRPAARGGLPPAAPAPPDPGASGRRGKYRYPAVMKHIGEHLIRFGHPLDLLQFEGLDS